MFILNGVPDHYKKTKALHQQGLSVCGCVYIKSFLSVGTQK